MNSMLKRLLSFVLAVVMVMSYGVMPVSASEGEGSETGHVHAYVDGVCECGTECAHENAEVSETAATCTSDGSRTVTCACGYTSTETIGMIGHSYTEAVTTPATCTAEGVKTFTCACGDTYTETIAATGEHVYGEDGKCTCGAEKPEEHTHSYDEVVSDTATCTEGGVKTTKCSCGETTETESPAKGHNYVEGVCACGAKEEPAPTCNCEIQCNEQVNEACAVCMAGGTCIGTPTTDEPEKTCEEGCWLPEGHDGECEIVCQKNQLCVLDNGHEEPCMDMNGVTLVDSTATSISSSLINMTNPAETFISTEISNLNATESVVIKLYSGEKLIATTTLLKPEYYVRDSLSVKIVLTGESSSWKTVWEKDMPRADFVPDKMVLFVDSVETSSAEVRMISTSGEAAVNWKDVHGVKAAPVAEIDGIGYATLAAALEAVQDGETITLVEGAVGQAELSEEIDFTKNIEFTITGKAPEYALPVVTFQNATVNIKNAEILIPELDARQNATINVINSKVLDAGGNSIVKSYYNGKINITDSSTVYTMQVTTMGYINVSGGSALNATWQTNIYGNGLVNVTGGATFKTAAIHLTGQDYSGRDNTDADRAGKPANVVVDGATLIVGNVQSSGGADYSYNSSEGINVGTVSGKKAVLDIKNGATVSVYMANGETMNVGADGTVNVSGGTLNVTSRGEGNVTLANNGTVAVKDNSTLNIPTLSGTAVYVTDDATLTDSAIGGAVYAGYGSNKTDSLELKLAGTFSADYLYVGNKTENYPNGEVHKLTILDGATATFGTLNLRTTSVATVTNATVYTDDLLIRGSLTLNNSTLSYKDVSAGTGNWSIYEDDDASKTASLTLNNSTVTKTGYLVVGSTNNNPNKNANSNVSLTVNGGSMQLGTLYLQGKKDTFDNVMTVTNGATVTTDYANLCEATLDVAIGSSFNATQIDGTGTLQVNGTGFTGGDAVSPFGISNIINFKGNVTDNSDMIFATRGEAVDNTQYVVLTTAVAEVDGAYYTDLVEAINAADGKTVKLLKNAEVETLTISTDITLVPNGYAITAGTLSGSGTIAVDATGLAHGTTLITATTDNFAGELDADVKGENLVGVVKAQQTENGPYVYTYANVALPTATVTEIENDELTFALNFKADEATEQQLAYFGDWYADFELELNVPATFNANGNADGYLSGQYDAWSENWVNVPFEDVTMTAGDSLKIMEYAASLMGQSGLKLTYNGVYSFVKDFDCGVFFDDEFLQKCIDSGKELEVSLELRMYNPADEDQSYTIGKTYTFESSYEAFVDEDNDGKCDADETKYTTIEKAIANAGKKPVVIVNDYKIEEIEIPAGITVVVNGTSIQMPNEGTMTLDDNGNALIVPALEKNGIYGTVKVGKNTYQVGDGASITIDKDGDPIFNDKNNDIVNVSSGMYQITRVTNVRGSNVTEGSRYYTGTSSDLVFDCNGFYELFDHVTIDGVKLNESYYSTKEGSTILTLKNKWLKNQDVDEYTLTMHYKNGMSASCVFRVRNSPSVADETNYKTGDSIFMAVSVMTFSAAALAVLLMGKKKYA